MEETEEGEECSQSTGIEYFTPHFHMLRAHLKVKFFPSFLPTDFYACFLSLLEQNEGKWRGRDLPPMSVEPLRSTLFGQQA
jgi:hypothetical protein